MALARENIITGLDIGSTAVRVAVGTRSPDGELQIVGAAEGPSEGISKGTIVSIEDTIASIASVLEKAERICGLPLEHAVVGVSGSDIVSELSRGVVAVSSPSGEVRPEDVGRVLEAAQAVATPPNYEILHVIPRVFSVDNQAGVKDPVGMTGIRLEVEAQIIEGLSSQIKNLTRAVNRASLAIDELVFSTLAAAEVYLSRRQREIGAVLINLGGTTTSMTVFEEGDLIATKVFPIGSRHITSDIAIGLRISIDDAEEIKVDYGSCLPQKVDRREEINFSDINASEEGRVSRRNVAQIIEARAEEILTMINEELKKIDRAGKLPAGTVLVGGGVKLDGIVELAKNVLKLPVSLGKPLGFTSLVDKVSDLGFANALGLVAWGAQAETPRFGFLPSFIDPKRFIQMARRWIESILP